jgi:hypothetical protein
MEGHLGQDSWSNLLYTNIFKLRSIDNEVQALYLNVTGGDKGICRQNFFRQIISRKLIGM